MRDNLTMGEADADRSPWWHSFYWRLGATFVVFVVAVIMAQSVIFTYRIEQSSLENPARSPNNISIGAAAQLSRALEEDRVQDLNAFLKERFPRERALYVVMRDGRVAGTSPEPLSPAIREATDMVLNGSAASGPDQQPRVPGPVVFAPIQADGQLIGLVVMPPPRPQGVVRDATRLVSLPSIAILVVATILAAFAIFGPARRRLVELESAAVRIGRGDWSARAPEWGRDEIAQVSRAFNRMGTELAAKDEALRTSDRLRRQLLADVSHELRTPLTAMKGYFETLQLHDQRIDPERRAQYLQTVAGETLRLERIVNDLFELARHENKVGSLDVRVFAIQRVFDHVIRRHEKEVEQRGVTITADVADTADQIVADPSRLEQVVDNLVANALRYVPPGGTIELKAGANGDGTTLAVIDSGPGIPPEHVDHVFDRFYKADAARASETAGSGLGLSIVKAIVERHGGTVGVTSRPGRTEFTVTLPRSSSV